MFCTFKPVCQNSQYLKEMNFITSCTVCHTGIHYGIVAHLGFLVYDNLEVFNIQYQLLMAVNA